MKNALDLVSKWTKWLVNEITIYPWRDVLTEMNWIPLPILLGQVEGQEKILVCSEWLDQEECFAFRETRVINQKGTRSWNRITSFWQPASHSLEPNSIPAIHPSKQATNQPYWQTLFPLSNREDRGGQFSWTNTEGVATLFSQVDVCCFNSTCILFNNNPSPIPFGTRQNQQKITTRVRYASNFQITYCIVFF